MKLLKILKKRYVKLRCRFGHRYTKYFVENLLVGYGLYRICERCGHIDVYPKLFESMHDVVEKQNLLNK